MSYQTLFGLDIFHDYYQDKICSDFSLEPTPACYKILKGHRLILKNKINGIQVIARFNDQGEPWIKIAEDVKFTFLLKLKNTKFVEFTDIAAQPNSNSVYLFKNQNITENKSLELGRKLEKLSNITLLQRHNVWGVVEIYHNSSLPQKNNYKITFQAKKQHWKYYLITNQDTQDNEFIIRDRDNTRSPKIIFTQKKIDKQDRVVAMIAQQFPDSQQYLFQSKNEIDDREVPRRDIQLIKKETKMQEKEEKTRQKRRKTQSSTVWIEHLPNPPDSSATKIINLLQKN